MKSLKVSSPLEKNDVLKAVRESGGTFVDVSDEEILDAVVLLGKMEGIFSEPGAAASIAGLKKLVECGKMCSSEKVVLLSQSSSSLSLSISGDLLFRLQPNDTRQALAIRRLTVDLGLKAVAVVYAREAYAEGLWKECEPKWRESGVEIIESLGVDMKRRSILVSFLQ